MNLEDELKAAKKVDKDCRLTVRLNEVLLRDLNFLARKHNTTSSELTRIAIERLVRQQ